MIEEYNQPMVLDQACLPRCGVFYNYNYFFYYDYEYHYY